MLGRLLTRTEFTWCSVTGPSGHMATAALQYSNSTRRCLAASFPISVSFVKVLLWLFPQETEFRHRRMLLEQSRTCWCGRNTTARPVQLGSPLCSPMLSDVPRPLRGETNETENGLAESCRWGILSHLCSSLHVCSCSDGSDCLCGLAMPPREKPEEDMLMFLASPDDGLRVRTLCGHHPLTPLRG